MDCEEHSDEEIYDTEDEIQNEPTFNDLIHRVNLYNNSKGLDITLESIYEIVNNLALDMEYDKEILDEQIEILWDNMEYIIEYQAQHLLRKDPNRIRQNFISWMYDNTSSGQKIVYYEKLRNELVERLPS